MAKTRAQTANIAVKKKEEEDRKPIRLLYSGSNTRTHNKVAKRKSSKTQNMFVTAQQVKVEENTDIKSLLKSIPNPLKLPKGRYISQEQINQLIDYAVNHGLSVRKASRKVKISQAAGLHYYKEYKNDPEKKIPTPRSQLVYFPIFSTQQQIENLIKYISEDKMTIAKASAKANMSYLSGYRYYKIYLKDPDHKIPIPPSRQNYTQDQKNELIGYVINDKMTIRAASLKLRMNVTTARKYYHEYFNNQNPDIPTPSHIIAYTHYTQEHIKELISYIVNDKLSMVAASRKINMCQQTTRKYYRQYLKDHNMEIPVSKFTKRYTQDEIKQFIRYITDDKMSLTAASKKANMNFTTGKRHYRKYLNGQKRDTSI